MRTKFYISFVLFAFVISFFAKDVNAQLGNLNKLKKKKENVIQLIISNQSVPVGEIDLSAFPNNLNAGDEIYARLNLGAPVSEVAYPSKPKNVNSTISLFAQINGEGKLYNIHFFEVKNDNDFDTYEIIVNPSVDKAKYAKLLTALMPGNNTVKFLVKIDGDDYASSEIILTKSSGDVITIGKTFNDFKAVKKDPALEAGIKEAAQKIYTDAGSNVKVMGVKISDSDWFIERDKVTKLVLNRQMGAFCYAKWPDGHCTVQKITFCQDYDGSAYSKNFRRYSSGDKVDVDCN